MKTGRAWLAIPLLLVAQGCFPSGGDLRHGSEHQFKRAQFLPGEKVRLLTGEIIGRGLVLFAEDHNGKFPDSLTALAPAYVGTNIDVGKFNLHYAGKESPGELVIVAAEKDHTQARFVVIRGDGIAYLLRPGD
jgi:hypothetical protein